MANVEKRIKNSSQFSCQKMKENYKCEQYFTHFPKIAASRVKLDYCINKLIDNYVVLFATICREEQDIFLWNFYFLLVTIKLLLSSK